MSIYCPDEKSDPAGYSASVQLFLHVEDVTYELSDVGPQDATLRKPHALIEGSNQALLEIIVDGRSEKRELRISSSDANNRVRFLS